MQSYHNIDTGEITDDREDIGYHTAFPLSEFDEAPSLIAAVEMDQERRQ
jgi:hypothetical protein